MAKTKTAAELIQAEIADLRRSDEERAARVRRIEALQLPIADEVAQILATKPVTEVANLLPELAANLTDNMQAVVTNMVNTIGYALNVLDSERQRISQQIEADAKAEADAQADPVAAS